MNAEVVAIGSELLLGQIVDTNSAWMAQRLAGLGVNLYYKTTVGDNPGRMREVLSQALDRSDLVITTGGIGPTQDDLTREIVAEVTGRELVRDQALLQQIRDRFQRRGLIITSNNEKQADIPAGAIPVENPNGTAPSFIVEDPRGSVICLPGVPFEMKWLFDNEVVPYLRGKYGLSAIITYRVLKVSDLGESSVDDRIGHLMSSSTNPTVGVLAHPGQVDVRIAAMASDSHEADKLIGPVEDEVRLLLGRHVFAVNERTMEDVVGELLAAAGATVAVYEDVTGGMTCDRLLGASHERLLEGVVSGDASSARRILAESGHSGDALEALLRDGAALADALAGAVRTRSLADLGLAVHGLPGRDQTSENLGQGMTYVSVSWRRSLRNRTYSYSGRGLPDRTRLSMNALDLLRQVLIEDW